MGVYHGLTPGGRYDLPKRLRELGLWKPYDFVLIFSTARYNQPVGLDAFDCPVFLVIADTHQFEAPIATALGYAQSHRFAGVVMTFTPQHAHWFAQAGIDRLAWFPSLPVSDVRRPTNLNREPRMVFVGNAGNDHPRRRAWIDAMIRRGLPLLVTRGTREAAADLYATSRVSWNGSMNGDLNMRVFEVLSGGGVLLTDRLSARASLDRLFADGHDLLTYASEEEMLSLSERLLSDPKAGRAIAAHGQATYGRDHSPAQVVRELRQWEREGTLRPLRRLDFDDRREFRPCAMDLSRRIALYELVQRFHRRAELRLLVSLATPDVSQRVSQDLSDLPHARISWLVPTTGEGDIPDGDAQATKWDLVIGSQSVWPDASSIPYHHGAYVLV